MMRCRRWWVRILLAPLYGVLPLALASCAMFRAGNPATTPGAGYGPCKSWVDCSAHEVIIDPDNRCCPPTTACAVDNGGPYCAADENYDPADPVTWGKKSASGKTKRLARSAHGK